MFYS
ncbi:hypothetical protein D043_1591A, partial [Vibrio parahaemolyticus EKP-021]